MNPKKNIEQNDTRSSSGKTKNGSRTKEKFDTGSHTPPSLRNVGPGYDDTGHSYEKSKEIDARNPEKKRSRKQHPG